MFPFGCPPTAGRIRGEILERFFPLFVSFVLIDGNTEGEAMDCWTEKFLPHSILFTLIGGGILGGAVCLQERMGVN